MVKSAIETVTVDFLGKSNDLVIRRGSGHVLSQDFLLFLLEIHLRGTRNILLAPLN